MTVFKELGFPNSFSEQKTRFHPFSDPHKSTSTRMHSPFSLLLIFTAFSAMFFPPGSALVLQSTSPPSSTPATTGTTSTSSNPSTNHYSREPLKILQLRDAGAAPQVPVSTIASSTKSSTGQNFILRLQKYGTSGFGLRKYYIPEKHSGGLDAFAFFWLPFAQTGTLVGGGRLRAHWELLG